MASLRAIFASILLWPAGCTTPAGNPTPPPDSAFYLHEGVKIHFKEVGAGRPLVFIHGFGTSLETWRFIAPPLERQFRLVLLDLKGHGLSDRPLDERYSIQAQAEIVLGLMRHLHLKQAVLVGHSFGAAVAVRAALEDGARELVSGLVLIGGSLDADRLPFAFNLLRAPLLGWLSLKLTTASFRTRMMLKRVYHDDSKVTDDLVELYAKYQRGAGAHYMLLKTAQQIVPPDLRLLEAKARKMELPAINIWGTQDKVITRASAEAVCGVLRNCAFIALEGVGHIPQEEAPEQVVVLLKEFLRSGLN
ncbi:MAG TPA: alpha/beta fold hydrolase [Candidatus Acidoferrales bacterium]|nr:alpha/beta fold hydrolase [Candidatus Acidoferrales bacterium]